MLECGVMSGHRVLLAAGLLYILVTNVIWMIIDTRPPFWDMAYHQSTALRMHDAFVNEGSARLCTRSALVRRLSVVVSAVSCILLPALRDVH
jgi:hypothetical protein